MCAYLCHIYSGQDAPNSLWAFSYISLYYISLWLNVGSLGSLLTAYNVQVEWIQWSKHWKMIWGFAQIGSYFGSILQTVDVDKDSLTDLLLVGAPMYMGPEKDEQGRVYVYRLKVQKISSVG